MSKGLKGIIYAGKFLAGWEDNSSAERMLESIASWLRRAGRICSFK